MEIFNVIDVRPNESIKIISNDESERIGHFRNITHILHARYGFDVVVVSSSYFEITKMRYEKIFPNIRSFFSSVCKKEICFNQNTVLLLDECCNSGNFQEILTNISGDSKFRNVIFGVSKFWSAFRDIETDVTFCTKRADKTAIYTKFFDKKEIPIEIFTDIFTDCTRDDNLMMLEKKDNATVIRKCIMEKKSTYTNCYRDHFSYNKNIYALYHIHYNFSVYHDINGDLYTGLCDNIDMIAKYSYVLFAFRTLHENTRRSFFLPRELRLIIVQLMASHYQKNARKINPEKIANYFPHVWHNMRDD